MCGIAGIISCTKQLGSSHLKQMTDALAHRGPDGEGLWTDEQEGVFLGHRRLSIIDLSSRGHQPMHYLDRYIIIHNGEIYNYLELKSSLETKGYHFLSQTDTEVIAAAFDHWGKSLPEHLEGMFAFAIWDQKEKQLFIARDRMGEKPLYYSFNPLKQELLFASELKAFWAIGMSREFSEDMLAAYLTLGITVHPTDNSRTFYKEYFQLKPGHYAIFKPAADSKNFESVPYWTCSQINNANYSDDEAIELFQQHFYQSISNRLRADVKIGTSLSGGLDSSAVVAAIHRQRTSQSNYSQHCFTAVFPGFEKNEEQVAKTVANQFHLHQHLVYPQADDFATFLPALIEIQEEPIGSASVYAQFKVFEEAKKQGVKVLLDGQGADELLGGYSKYRHWALQELLVNGSFAAFLREKRALSNQDETLNWDFRNYFAAFFPEKTKLQLQKNTIRKISGSEDLHPDFLKAVNQAEIAAKPIVKKLNDLLYYNSFRSGLNELLRYADKNSMANSCELRLPFLYHPLVEFVFSLPLHFKIRDGFTKWILRKSVTDLVPGSVVATKVKIGFEPPQESWMQNKNVIELIHTGRENLYKKGVLTSTALNKKIQPHTSYAAEGKDWRYLSAGLLAQ